MRSFFQTVVNRVRCAFVYLASNFSNCIRRSARAFLHSACFGELDLRVDKSYYYNKWSLMLYFDVQNAYNFKSDQPDYLTRAEDANGSPITDPDNPNKYLLKTLKNTSGTVLPTLGIMIEF